MRVFMPKSDREISIVGGTGGADADGDEEEDDDQVGIGGDSRGRVRFWGGDDVDDAGDQKQRLHGCTQAKQLVLLPLTKVKKQFNLRRERKRNKTKASSSKYAAIENASFSSSSDQRVGVGIGIGEKAGCFCIRSPQVVESSRVQSGASDPNDPTFTSDMLRILIEKNDFYCKQCNPHTELGTG